MAGVRAGLRHYWRSHLAVAVGAAVATAVLSGALVVGDSVRGSLTELTLSRLGSIDHAILADGLFRAALADDLAAAYGSMLENAPENWAPRPGEGGGPEGDEREGDEREGEEPEGDEPGGEDRDGDGLPAGEVALAAAAGDAAADGGAATRQPPVIAAPVLIVRGSAVAADGGQRASQVTILGVDERFSELYPEAPPLDFQQTQGQLFPSVLINRALARELAVGEGDQLLLSFAGQSDIPEETLVGRRDAGEGLETLRLSVAGVLPDLGPGGFRLSAQQAHPFNAFVGLRRMQRVIGRRGQANGILVGSPPEVRPDRRVQREALAGALRTAITAADVGLELRVSPAGPVSVESSRFVLPPPLVEAVEKAAVEQGGASRRVLTYLANRLAVGDASVPYSTVAALAPAREAAAGERAEGERQSERGAPGRAAAAGTAAGRSGDSPEPPVRGTVSGEEVPPAPGQLGRLDLAGSGEPAPLPSDREILLDAWTAERLAAQGATPEVGDEIELSYYQLGAGDELSTVAARFRLAGVVAMSGLAVDDTLTPKFPGMSDADDMSAWDPPFPVDLDAIGRADEDYWDRYRAAPKAFVSYAEGERLWRSRFGAVTAVRVAVPGIEAKVLAGRLETRLPRLLEPQKVGFAVRPLRRQGLDAAQGATDFSGLFLGFSFFLIASAILLVGLLFRLGVEQRGREVGLLRAIGYPAVKVRLRLLGEGAVPALLGSLLGTAGAVAYGGLMLAGLRSWWLPAVGEPVLDLHLVPSSLALGALASLLVIVTTIIVALRHLDQLPVPALLAGSSVRPAPPKPGRRARWVALAFLVAGLALSAVALGGDRGHAPGLTFGTGACLLIAGVAAFAAWCRGVGAAGKLIAGGGRSRLRGRGRILLLGARNSSRAAGRSVLSVGLIASACFLIVAVESFRGGGEIDVADLGSGAGGFTLMAESDVPLTFDPLQAAESGAADFDRSAADLLTGVEIFRLRLLPGDDASCLNLYRPQRPRVLGVPPELIARGGFSFQQLSGQGEGLEQPWQLLIPDPDDDAIPAFADYNSAVWILKAELGDTVSVPDGNGGTVRLRLVGLFAKSIFQSELLISEQSFLASFPQVAGSSYFLIDAPPQGSDRVAATLEEGLARYGFDATSTADRLAAFQAVENTYLSTFQTLGGLGLLLGTLGLAIVLLRNVLERRGELATLRAFGFRRRLLSAMVVAENAFLLAVGIAIGAAAALTAVAPHALAAGVAVPWLALAGTLALVLAVGLLASLAAVRSALAVPLLPQLKAE